MKTVNARPSALKACTVKGLNQELTDWNAKLDSIQRALDDYLDRKRRSFARFFFLSNEEMFDILSKLRDPKCVQPHLKKCFEGLTVLNFAEEAGSDLILSMESAEGEKVELSPNLRARGPVEEWLS